MTALPIAEARRELNHLPEKLRKAHEAITVTRRGKPIMAIMDWEFYETIIETVEILGDAKIMRDIKRGIRDIKAGKGISWEKAKRELVL